MPVTSPCYLYSEIFENWTQSIWSELSASPIQKILSSPPKKSFTTHPSPRGRETETFDNLSAAQGLFQMRSPDAAHNWGPLPSRLHTSPNTHLQSGRLIEKTGGNTDRECCGQTQKSIAKMQIAASERAYCLTHR
jgi:hypothetical protein